MPVLKHVRGHTGTRGVVAYLTKDGRALAFATHNLSEAGEDWLSYAAEMDETRRAFGLDGDLNQRGAANLRYQHFILSPDPADSPTPEQVLELAEAWASRYLGHFQWLAVVHDDGEVAAARGEAGPVHAHVVVNNVDLMDGSSLASYLSEARARRMFDGLQRMAGERGMRGFGAAAHDALSQAADEAADEARSRARAARPARVGRGAPDALDAAEAAIARSGRPTWKDDLRARVLVAEALASDLAGFVSYLSRLGVDVSRAEVEDACGARAEAWRAAGVEPAAGRRARGALFSSRENPRLRCYGSTMGGRYSDEGVGLALSSHPPVPEALRARAAELVGDLCGPAPSAAAEPAGIVEAAYSYESASRLTARQVADALDAIRESGATSAEALAAYDAEAALVAETIGYRFPRPVGAAARPARPAGGRGARPASGAAGRPRPKAGPGQGPSRGAPPPGRSGGPGGRGRSR